MTFDFDSHIIGTTWDIKKQRINSENNELKYAQRDNDEERIRYWTALIEIRKKMRQFLDTEWRKNRTKVKTEEDFIKYVQQPAEEKAEKYFNRSNHDLHTGDFGDKLINKYSKGN
jgi:pullulanase/glycogen debranching enzyme